jgi:3-hydroxyacyl-CoA dehydrogenase/enoyl-CoA hydratase/3-hydroxybutyryl-CoA epimerase/enoyl-CoA isomerase
MDTMQHCDDVICEAYPERLKRDFPSWYQLVLDLGGLGQKNGKGFYQYTMVDGRPAKTVNSEVKDKIGELAEPARTFSQEQIVERMMIPLGIEMAYALEEKIVASPEEGDISMLYGVGFPAFKGGVARWMDSLGLQTFCDLADKYVAELGALYEVTDVQREMAANGDSYYS